MKILVFIKEVPDIRIPLACDEYAGKLRADWNVSMLNPADNSAIEAALKMKKGLPGTQVTVVHLGPASGERLIRECLALGCDEGLRIWEEGLEEIHATGKALIFARIAEITGFDLILTGARSQDIGSAQLGVLLALHLALPSISSVIAFQVKGGTIAATKRLAQGYHEYVEAPTPAVITVETHEEPCGYASPPCLLEATEREIPCYDLSRIGISSQLIRHIENCLNIGPLRFPTARPRFTPAPDSTLPAFLRIRKLIEGTITRREGKLVRRAGWIICGKAV
ncbi:MAG: hypothetical protein ABSC19_18535 [Syntrophorhabdales bacterium]